jgi:hypothetical protein
MKPDRLLLALAIFCGLTAPAARADRLMPSEPTPWGHPTDQGSTVRGIAYDGRYTFVSDCDDYTVDHRSNDQTGRVYIYDRDGTLVKRIPEKPPVRGTFFGTGVATDGARLWTSGYFDPHIYEYDISTGKLLRRIDAPPGMVVRLDYDAEHRALIVTHYGNGRIDALTPTGKLRGTLKTRLDVVSLNAAPDGRGDLWVADWHGQVMRLDRHGDILQSYAATSYTGLATNIHDRSDGFMVDLQPTFDQASQQWQVHFQHFGARSVGGSSTGLDDPAVTCLNTTTGQSVQAHFAVGPYWNCEDAGLVVKPGDAVDIHTTGAAR